MSILKAVRGTRDLLPPETELWNHVEATARRVFALYNFGEIRTPIFEDTQLFARGVGEETDIVSKEMYTWADRERFDEHALRNSWHAMMFDDEYPKGYETGVRIGPSKVDLIAYRRGIENGLPIEVVELVNFRATVQRADLDQLQGAVDAYVPINPAASKRGILVVPKERNVDTTDSKRKLPPQVKIEPLLGDYFQSSQSLTLRPENTAGVVRAYIEHGLGDSGLLQKLYYIGPQFRRERPQRGRYRQFFQIGAEVIGPPSAGSESPVRDAEVLEMLATFLDQLGISGWSLKINSVGSASDRPRYVAALREALRPVAPTMCVDCQRRAETNPLRVLDCKHPEDQAIIESLPKIADYLDDASRAHFAAVRAALDACGVAYEVTPRLVRGLDYYTRTTFEFTHGGLGAQNALLGGGRYDGLSEMLGGPKAPGIGFAIGADRLVLTLQASSGAVTPTLADAYLAPLGEALAPEALKLARELRAAGLRIELGDGSFRLKKSFETANKLARQIVLLGEDEVQSGILTVKDFASGEQTKVPREQLAAVLNKPQTVVT